MKALPWLIALAFLALILIQEDRVNEYREERDAAIKDFDDGARIFWSGQAEAAAVRAAYRNHNLEMAVKIKQQELSVFLQIRLLIVQLHLPVPQQSIHTL